MHTHKGDTHTHTAGRWNIDRIGKVWRKTVEERDGLNVKKMFKKYEKRNMVYLFTEGKNE